MGTCFGLVGLTERLEVLGETGEPWSEKCEVEDFKLLLQLTGDERMLAEVPNFCFAGDCILLSFGDFGRLQKDGSFNEVEDAPAAGYPSTPNGIMVSGVNH